MDAKDFIHDIQVGMKGLTEFEVQVRVPEGFYFYGGVPFDMHIVNGVAFVTVKAQTIEQATEIAEEYFRGQSN
jgi:hypothetical protein